MVGGGLWTQPPLESLKSMVTMGFSGPNRCWASSTNPCIRPHRIIILNHRFKFSWIFNFESVNQILTRQSVVERSSLNLFNSVPRTQCLKINSILIFFFPQTWDILNKNWKTFNILKVYSVKVCFYETLQ